MTGRFFGVLRSTWQVVALLFFALSAAAFTARTPVWIYQCVLAMGAVAVACRGRFYKALPEVPFSAREALPLTESVKTALALPGFAAYLGYLLLLVCVTGNGADMLRLSAVRGAGLGDDQVLFLTVGSMSGSLVGFATAGKWVDRFGPRTLFLACHIGFAVALAFFPARALLHLPPLAAGLSTSFLLGLSTSTLGLATTAQSFRICQGTQRTIAYALVSAVQTMGSGLSGFALAALLGCLGATTTNPFDFALAALSGTVLLQIAALGLIPNRKHDQQTVPSLRPESAGAPVFRASIPSEAQEIALED
jgi:MFS family permease